MSQVSQSLLWSNDGLYFKSCSNYLYLPLFCCSLFRENPRCEPMLTETTPTKTHTKYHDRKASWRPFTASIKPVEESLRNFNANSVVFQPSIDLQPSVDRTSTVFLRFYVVL